MALNNHVENFTLDMAPGGIAPVLNVSQGDTGRAYTADMYWGGASYDVSGLTVRLRGRKRDNTVFDYALPAPSGTKVAFDLEDKEQVTIIPGNVECELVFTDSDSRVVGSANFVFIVEEAPYDPNAISESEVTGLVDLISDQIPGAVGDWFDDNLGENETLDGIIADGVSEYIDENGLAIHASDLVGLADGVPVDIQTYLDATSFSGGIGGNIYKCSEHLIPAKSTVKTVEIYANNTVYGALFIVDENNVILYKQTLSSVAQGWNTITVNASFDVPCYIAVRGMQILNTYTTTAQANMYSIGLYEANGDTYGVRGIGETIPFAQVVPTRYYQFKVKIHYEEVSLKELLEPVCKPSDFTTPKMQKTGETGYSLFGKWYRMTDTQNECANCGGASIAFKVKGATAISVDIEQLVRNNDDQYKMAEEPFFAYSIDGAAFTRVQISTDTENSVKTIPIPTTDEHLVWIVIDGMCQSSGGANRSTGWSGVYIKALTSNGTMYRVKPAEKQILFVGDSMVEGINTLGTNSLSSSNSNTAEWSFKAATELHAFPLMQGYGGTTTWQGVKFEQYSRPDYNQDTYITTLNPDIIVCEYGHNDYSVIQAGTRTEAEFIENYRLLLNLLEQRYPGVPIVIIIPFAQRLADAVRQVAATKPYYYLVETSEYDYQTTDGTHPSAASGTAISKSFADDMKDLFGVGFFLG